MLKIGLTGGIASGKSLVSHYFLELGIEIIDADQIAKNLFRAKSKHLIPLIEHFGKKIIDNNGELNRKALGKIVFSDPVQLNWLNQYSHPLVNLEMKQQLSKVKSQYVILDIPLLIDKGSEVPSRLRSFIDRILVVKTEQERQIERIISRDGRSKEDALAIINNQSSLKEKLALADDVIDNNKTKKDVKKQVSNLHTFYQSI
ncbi:MAG: dephospho-CoA kinase [Gammaproteobacteria bacterium]|nr:MAG: dephospho-CoA kinase [Gammaproteobacteria bacterium]